MSVEELRKIAKEEASKFIMENLNSAIIFTYIQNLEKEIENLKEINKEHQKLNGELRDEIKRQGNTREIEEKYIEENFISKDEIREKIKDLEDYMILFTNDKEKFNRYKYARDILEKLL